MKSGPARRGERPAKAAASRNPDAWKTGGEPMTSAQKSYLHTLAREANELAPEKLTKAEAAKQIEKLQKKTGRAK